MVVYPLSLAEVRTLRWAVRILPILSGAIILLLGAMSAASTAA